MLKLSGFVAGALMSYWELSAEDRPPFDVYLQMYGLVWDGLSDDQRNGWKIIAAAVRHAGYGYFNADNWQVMVAILNHFQG